MIFIILIIIFLIFYLKNLSAQEYMINIFNYAKKKDDFVPKLILQNVKDENEIVETPDELMNRQIDTFEKFNNVSSHRFDAVDKYNKSIMFGENKKLIGKTLWEIYDIGCDDGINNVHNSADRNIPLYDDYEIARYATKKNAKNKKFNEFRGLELNGSSFQEIINKKKNLDDIYLNDESADNYLPLNNLFNEKK